MGKQAMVMDRPEAVRGEGLSGVGGGGQRRGLHVCQRQQCI